MKKISVLLLVIVSFFFCYTTNSSNINIYAEVESSAKSMVLIEKDSGRILAQKDKDIKLPMASTTKIITALTVLENVKHIDEAFVINNKAVGIEGTSIYLKKDEKLTIRELLYGLILASGNDASMALAIKVGGSEDGFVKLMNKTAKNAGAYNTNFVNPHGLDAEGHYTTAYDLALITAKALNNPLFCEIISTKNIKISGSTPDSYRYLKNKNKLLWTYDGCTGVKTGFTDNAGRCFVGSATKNNMTLISVVFNCVPMFEDTARLFNFGFDNYINYELLPAYKYHRKVSVNNGRQNDVKLFTKKSFSYPLTNEEIANISYVYNLPEIIDSPISKEQEVGNIEIYLKNDLLFEEKIYTMEEVKSINFFSNLKEIFSHWK